MAISSGEAQVERCRFSGATSDDGMMGGGYITLGTAHAEIRKCETTGNGYGIIVRDHAYALLEDNQCWENPAAGIVFSRASSGIAGRNLCQNNAMGASLC